MDYIDKLFWILFIILGASVIVGSMVSVMILDILLGITIIALGIHKLSQEISYQKAMQAQDNVQKKITHLLEWLEQNHIYTKNINKRTDIRFEKIHKRHEEIDENLEKKYRELAKKVFELENKLNEISRAFVIKERVRSGREKSL